MGGETDGVRLQDTGHQVRRGGGRGGGGGRAEGV